MIKESFLTKLHMLFEIMKKNSNILYIVIILIILSLFIILLSKIKNKYTKISCLLIYISFISYFIYSYYEEFLKLVDYLIENIVNNLLFPNLAVYILILLIVNVILIKTLFSKKIKPYVRNINVVSFSLMQLFLYLIIDNIITNNINIYEKLSIYTNHNLLILIELNMQIFVVWIITLGVIKLIDYLIEKDNKKLKTKKNIIYSKNQVSLTEENYYADYMDDIYEEYIPIKKIK